MRKNGTSAPMPLASRRSVSGGSGGSTPFASRSAVGVGAAAAPAGDRNPLRDARPSEAGRRRPRRASPGASDERVAQLQAEGRSGPMATRSERSSRCSRDDLVLAVRPGRPDDEREVDLAVAGARLTFAARRRARRTRAAQAPRRASRGHVRARRARPRPAPRRDAGQRQRVRQRLAPVGERSVDDCSNARPVGRPFDALEGDERGVDIRRRAEYRARDRVEARAASGELDQYGDCAVGLGRAARRSVRRPPVAPSRTTCESAGRRGSPRRAVWRRCRAGWRRACSAAAPTRRDRARARRPSGARRSCGRQAPL